MKNRTLRFAALLATGLMVTFGLNAQSLSEANVPFHAAQSFHSSVPGITPSWQAGPDATFEAKFDRQGKSLVYVYDSKGALQQKKQQGSLGALPGGISSSIASTYPGVEPTAAYKVITRTKQRYFEVVVPGRGTIDYMRFDVSGNPVGKSSLALAEQPVTTPDPLVAKPKIASATPAPEVEEKTINAQADIIMEPERPAYNSMPMRGESSNVTSTEINLTDEIDIEAEMMDDDIRDLFNDEEEFDLDSMDDDGDDWEDIDLLEMDDDDDWEDIDPFQ